MVVRWASSFVCFKYSPRAQVVSRRATVLPPCRVGWSTRQMGGWPVPLFVDLHPTGERSTIQPVTDQLVEFGYVEQADRCVMWREWSESTMTTSSGQERDESNKKNAKGKKSTSRTGFNFRFPVRVFIILHRSFHLTSLTLFNQQCQAHCLLRARWHMLPCLLLLLVKQRQLDTDSSIRN